MADNKALKKLLIKSYAKADCSGTELGSINAFINPENYNRSCSTSYANVEAIGDPKQTKSFKGMGPDILTLGKLVVDGTGIVPLGKYADVDAYITAFRDIVYSLNGDQHRPNYLLVIWGNFKFIGVCTTLNVNYTMFKPDGTACRASIDLKLQSTIGLNEKLKQAQLNSPDMTHMRVVKAGDTLPLMTFRIYGDASYYLEVARANGLKSIHALRPGDQLYFPPLKK